MATINYEDDNCLQEHWRELPRNTRKKIHRWRERHGIARFQYVPPAREAVEVQRHNPRADTPQPTASRPTAAAVAPIPSHAAGNDVGRVKADPPANDPAPVAGAVAPVPAPKRAAVAEETGKSDGKRRKGAERENVTLRIDSRMLAEIKGMRKRGIIRRTFSDCVNEALLRWLARFKKREGMGETSAT